MKAMNEHPSSSSVPDLYYPATKLHKPRLGASVVRRPHLIQLLDNGSKKQVVQIIAPTGYGKTTLLTEWLSFVHSPDRHSVWISLDSNDNDLIHFWTLLAHGIQMTFPDFEIKPGVSENSPINLEDFTALNPLINEIARIATQVYLVLDDIQVITDEHVLHSIHYLILRQPINLHLILSGREMFPIPLSRLRAQGQLLEINFTDLAFKPNEARIFLTKEMRLKIDDSQIQQLIKTTDGWIAGLKLFALAIQKSDSDQFLNFSTISAEKQKILEYLTEEVLNQQDEDTQTFLLKTSILTNLSAPLCDAILGRSDSQRVLAGIEKANLFITSIDLQQRWYQYQELFAQLLNILLERMQPNCIPELHHRAFLWLMEHGYPDMAIAHALSPEDLDLAAKQMDEKTIQAIIKNDLLDFVHWLSRFSNNLFDQYPELCIHYALANFSFGRLTLVKQALRKAEQLLNDRSTPGVNQQQLKWEIAVIQSTLEAYEGNLSAGIAQINQALEAPPGKITFFYGFLNQFLAQAYEALGDIQEVVRRLENASSFALDHGFKKGLIHSSTQLARIHRLQGQLRKAKSEYQQLIEYALQAGFEYRIPSLAIFGLADIAVEQNELETASDIIRPVMEKYSSVEAITAWVIDIVSISVSLSRFYLACHDHKNAFYYFEKAHSYFSEYREMFLLVPNEYISVQIQLWLIWRKRKGEKFVFSEDLTFFESKPNLSFAEQVALARYSLAQDRYTDAIHTLTRVEDRLKTAGEAELRIEALVLKAVVFQKFGEKPQAIQTLCQAVSLAAVEGYLGVFIQEGPIVRDLLQDIARSQNQNPSQTEVHSRFYVQKLLNEFDRSTRQLRTHDPEQGENENTHDSNGPLGEREKEVLDQLYAGKTTKEIASELKISINTVRTYLKSLYKKMGKHNRREVLQRAIEMGWIDDHKNWE